MSFADVVMVVLLSHARFLVAKDGHGVKLVDFGGCHTARGAVENLQCLMEYGERVEEGSENSTKLKNYAEDSQIVGHFGGRN